MEKTKNTKTKTVYDCMYYSKVLKEPFNSIEELMDACKFYFEQTGRRLTFEYSLVGGVNDTDQDARELSQLIKGINCHVNLIPVNPIKERDYVQSNAKVIEAFKNKLEKAGIMEFETINQTAMFIIGSIVVVACFSIGLAFIVYTKPKK